MYECHLFFNNQPTKKEQSMGGHHGIKQQPLSEKEALRRIKLLRALPKVLKGLDYDLEHLLYGDSREAFVNGITELRRIHSVLLKIKRAHDASTLPFFPEYQNFKGENGFLECEMLERLGHFLDRGLPPLLAMFQKQGIQLPVALERLHREYHNEKPPARKQQFWCSVFPHIAETLDSVAA